MTTHEILLDSEEIWRIVFDAGKGLISEPIGKVALIVLISLGGMFLKEYLKKKNSGDFIEKNPTLGVILSILVLALALGFLIWFFGGLYNALK